MKHSTRIIKSLKKNQPTNLLIKWGDNTTLNLKGVVKKVNHTKREIMVISNGIEYTFGFENVV